MNGNDNTFLEQYTAFNLKIKSCVRLPFSSAFFDQPDLVISKGVVDFDVDDYEGFGVLKKHPKGPVYKEVQVNDFQTIFFAYELGDVLVQNGNEIILDLNDAPSQKDWLELFIMSAVIPIILLQRGYFALHASCVRLGDKVVAFAGDSGMGKSTSAASLLTKGGQLISDDITIIDIDSKGKTVIYPEYRQLRLHEEAVEAIDQPELLNQGEHNEWAASKRLITVSGSENDPVFINRIYFLEWGEKNVPNLIPVNKTEAFDKIYRLVYRLANVSEERRVRNFKWISKVVERIPMKILRRPKDLTQIHEITDLIQKDLTE